MAVILAAAAVGFGVARGVGVPAVPLLVLAGIGLRVSGVLPDPALFQDAMVLGLTFLVFAAGTELNPRRVGRQRRAAVMVGLVQFGALGAAGLGVALALGFGWLTSLYLALALTASSTLVVVRLLQQRRQFFEPFGRLVLGVLLLQDVLIILLISTLERADQGPAAVGLGLLGMGGMIVLTGVCVRWLTPWLLLRMGLDEERVLLTVLAILFGFVGLANALELPLVAGAFLAGVSLSGFPVNGVVRGQLASLSDFFLAVFFVALGALLVVPAPREMLLVGGLALMVLLLTPPLVALVAERAGLSARSSLEGGLLLAQTSEFSLIVGLMGVASGHIEGSMLSVIALVTVITMIVTPLLATDAMTWRLVRVHPTRLVRWPEPGRGPGPTPAGPRRDHVLMLGCGTNGLVLLDQLLARGERVVIVDEDPAVVESLRQRGVEAIRGGGADHGVLTVAGARSARAIVSNMRRVRDNERMLRFARGGRALVRVFDPAEAERVRALGGVPIIESHAAADSFLAWFDRHFERAQPGG